MKKHLLTAMLLTATALSLSAQQSYTYLFSGTPFTSIPSGGPTLQTIGPSETPVAMTIPSTTCPQTPTINLTRFAHNSGFKAKAFFSDTYSIEMIFKFDELNGYNRIIDFSNSGSDAGIYTLSTCLNFYPNGNIGTCPDAFDTTNYKQVVVTRSADTKEMRIYFNAELFSTFVDNANHYVIGSAPNDSIKFFRDDNMVTNEASPGKVALIRMADHVLSENEVTSSFNDFCTRITSVSEQEGALATNVYPNPGNGQFVLDHNASSGALLSIINMQGQEIYSEMLEGSRTHIDMTACQNGVYLYRIMDGASVNTGRFIIQ
ncbi:MAG: T9SS type A sorting domain-containing protein [Flavobacteriales bacterium]|nr:T9SS type A sorting domain-containing protein [Flavobacteriales bacterium]